MTIDEINTIRLALDTPEHNRHYVKHVTDAKMILNKEQEAINYTHSCTELKTFDIHECINEVTKSANKLSPWIVDARKDRSFRYIIKKAIDKMLYSN